MFVYACRGDGLGTRIQVILHAKILAEKLGLPLKIVWPPIGSPFYEADRLLESQQLEQVIANNLFFRDGDEESGDILDGRIAINAHNMFIMSRDFKGYLTLEELRAELQHRDGVWYDLPQGLLTEEALGAIYGYRLKDFWAQINWTPRFRSLVAAVDAKVSLHDALAVHARRGDIVSMLREGQLDYLRDAGMEMLLQRFAALETLHRAVVAEPTGSGLIVCGEATEYYDYYLARNASGTTVIEASQYTTDETLRTFLDFYILAEAKVVIAPFLSYFSGAAALVGRSIIKRAGLDVPTAMAELFEILGSADRRDEMEVKALICTTYAKMLVG